MKITFGRLRMLRGADEPPLGSGLGSSDDMLKSDLSLLDRLGKKGLLWSVEQR